MSKYTLTIEGDFERYECNKCPLGILSVSGFVCVMDDRISCPLEEATVANNATVEEVKRGEWIVQDETYTKFKCSVCGSFNHPIKWNFCSICGADMRGGKE